MSWKINFKANLNENLLLKVDLNEKKIENFNLKILLKKS